MNKRLNLVRHAKSSWDNPSLKDHDRPLNRRGLSDAPKMGQRLLARGYKPQLIISSDAERAIETARIIANEISFSRDLIIPASDLYLASAKQILAFLAAASADHTDIMLVGHNPGMTELANQIANVRIDNMPTCSTFCIETAVTEWKKLKDQPGKLLWFDYPKKIGN